MYEHYCHTSISEGFSMGTNVIKKFSKVWETAEIVKTAKIFPGPEAL